MSLYSMMKSNGPSGFGYGSSAEEVTSGLDLAGKTILVTGCNSGLGEEAIRVLALRGAQVLGTARTQAKADEACAKASSKSTGFACELSDPLSVKACVVAVKNHGARLDAIICNAGIMALPKLEQAFGYELQFFTNHIGHFILVNGLLDELADDGRVVMVSSAAHRRAPKEGIQFDNLSGENGYAPGAAYGQSKLANLLFAKELARKLEGTQKTANAVHPGVIHTNLARSMHPVADFALGLAAPLLLKDVGQGAATQVFAAVSPKAKGISGKYLTDCNVTEPRRDANDRVMATKLWEVSEKIVAALP